MIKMNSKRKFMATLYAVYITFILLSVSSLFAYHSLVPKMDDTYEYNLTFKNDGLQSHYYVERNNISLDGKIDLTYTTSTNILDVDAYNLKVLHIDLKSMYEDESMKVFGIDPEGYPNYYKKYFIEKDHFRTIVDTDVNITNLTFKHTPVPVKVIVNGQEWWKSNANYTYYDEDIVFTLVPEGHSVVDVYFEEQPGLKPPVAAFTVNILGNKTVRFNASLSYDPNGKIESYLWDFGDYEHPFGTGCVVEHNYTDYANYTVVLTVRDDELLKDTEIKMITSGWEATPYEVIENVSIELKNAKTGDKKTDKRLDHVIKIIDKILDDKLWVDDSHLDPKHGKKVFDKIEDAIKELEHLLKKKDTPQSVKDACQAMIERLVKAAYTLAQIAFAEAQGYAGDKKVDKELDKCEDEFGKAQEELDHTKKDGKPDPKYNKAIDHYKKAWEHAQKAIKLGES